jgi:hypothetical protein
MRRRSIGAAIAITVAVAVALQWLPPKQEARHAGRAEADTTQITLSIRSEGLALYVERGSLSVTFRL